MAYRNSNGQILIESVFLLFVIISILIVFQIIIDYEKKTIYPAKLSKIRKDYSHEKTESNFNKPTK